MECRQYKNSAAIAHLTTEEFVAIKKAVIHYKETLEDLNKQNPGLLDGESYMPSLYKTVSKVLRGFENWKDKRS